LREVARGEGVSRTIRRLSSDRLVRANTSLTELTSEVREMKEIVLVSS
jgi:hypothetical protein